MALKKNIIANYLSQLYVTAIGIALLPLYIKYMGSEAYGLVGFFAMLQAWFNVLDLGLTPTVSREAARYNGGAVSALAFRQLYRALTIIFYIVAVIGGGGLFLSSSFIANNWLNLNDLFVGDVVVAVQIMAISVALRWMTGLYRGVVTGFEKLVWLSGFNALIATLRFVGVLISMWFFGFTPLVFFIHQFIVAMFENIGLSIRSSQLLPNVSCSGKEIGWSFKPVMPVLKFSLTIAFTASVWVLATQTDKLVLSGILPLDEYGYFTLAVLVANGIMVISGPVSTAIMPRMAKLYAENNHIEFIGVYKKATQLVAIISGSAAVTLIVTAKPLLIAWTGDLKLAEQAAPVLRLYTAGNLFLCISAFAYYLQYARGNLRYHFIGNIALVVIIIPSVIFSATKFGAIGAGYVWFSINALFLFFWVAYIHHKLEPKLHMTWLWNEVVKVLLPAGVFGIFLEFLNISITSSNRILNLMFVVTVGLFFIILALLFSGNINRILTFKKSFWPYERK
ncbi:polysaccharide biosynthesis protein [Vibrio splendidus]|uniref:oligosaccharide flippase family protein n=1 Tax=Vibrio splendidus TaxID=29497 RepID=UPI000D396084|nr:oligosaccharide flippase family protein [Vibrio splendidus]PTO51479.1 polysaccharide biosynthesis protein [Vibrio splendidus]